jgi:subtilisin family serine protease
MSAFRRIRFATTATALVFGTSLGLPAAAASGTVTASSDASNCTINNVSKAADQDKLPWEIDAAGLSTLKDHNGTPLDGSGVRVAVIDTGIQAPQQLTVARGAVNNGEKGGDAADDDGHGTMVASIIAAKKSNANAMQGIAPGVTLMSYREAGCKAPDGSGNTEDAMATAIDSAVSDGADVINISQDGYAQNGHLEQAVQDAYDQGVVIVASAGNQGDRDTTDAGGADYGVNPKTYPASYPEVLAVGAVDQNGMVPTFSETGNAKVGHYIGVVAPGVQVEGLEPDDTLAVDDGTSFAAPYVAAEAALIIEEHGWADDSSPSRAYDVMKIIEATADGDGGYSDSQGWGEVNIQAALTANVGDGLVAAPGKISGLTLMEGDGPNADGKADVSVSANRTVIQPYVAAAVNEEQQHQQRWAYIALVVGLLVAVVALAGSAVARDARRRNGGSGA